MSIDATDKAAKDLNRIQECDKRRRAIATLEIELAMTEAHAKKLSSSRAALTDPNQQGEIAALIREEAERAEQLRRQLGLLRDPS